MRRGRDESIRDGRRPCRCVNSGYVVNHITIEQVPEGNSRDIGAVDTMSDKDITTDQVPSQGSKRWNNVNVVLDTR